jgi:hypothetical protein
METSEKLSSERSGAESELATRTIKVERKIFHFDLKTNPRGDFLKITEESSGKRDVIIIPATGMEDFKNAITEVLEESGIDQAHPEDDAGPAPKSSEEA